MAMCHCRKIYTERALGDANIQMIDIARKVRSPSMQNLI